MFNDLEFMLNPESWTTGSGICLKLPVPGKGGVPYDFGYLIFKEGQYLFCPENDLSLRQSGGRELVEKLAQEGWIVD